MTDPLMPAFCCSQPSTYTQFFDMMVEIDSDPYNIVCLISATCGILGAIYQIVPAIISNSSTNWYWLSCSRGRRTVIWLALADLMATLGIFVRSLMKLIVPSMIQRIKSNVYCCYMLSFWIQYFYVVSWFWTLMYAIDIYLAVSERPTFPKLYHCISWITPAVFTYVGLYFLYTPDQKCFNNTFETFWRFLPNYLSSYAPLVIVMGIIPVLYYKSAGSLHLLISRRLSQYTNKERHVVDSIKIRFALINVTFYACWIPNLITTIVLYSTWNSWDSGVIISLWYIMAIMNPLQALFNCFVYQKPENSYTNRWQRLSPSSNTRTTSFEYGETTPLIAKASGSSNNSDDLDFVL